MADWHPGCNIGYHSLKCACVRVRPNKMNYLSGREGRLFFFFFFFFYFFFRGEGGWEVLV